MSSIPTTTTLSPLQESVALALGAGSTISGAAEDAGISRVTVYRWMKTCPAFSSAVQKARAEFLLSRRDDLHYLSNRALETLLAVLDNPHSSPAVLLRAASFILQRPHEPNKGWFMPEPLPAIDSDTITDSALLEKECARLACIDNLEPEEIDESVVPPVDKDDNDDDDAGEYNEDDEDGGDGEDYEDGQDDVCPGEDVTDCNETEREEESYTAIPHREGGMPSCPLPMNLIRNRQTRARYLDALAEYTAESAKGRDFPRRHTE